MSVSEDHRMIRLPNLTLRQILIVVHDLIATAAAITLTFFMRFEGEALDGRLHGLVIFLPLFLIYAAVVYFIFGLHRNKWRFTSVPDLYNLFRASTALAVSLLALDYVLLSPNYFGTFFFGKITILLYWFLQMFFLGGLRVVYQYLQYRRKIRRVRVADAAPTLVLGRTADRGQSIRGIPVLGEVDDLERVVADLEAGGDRVTRLILAPSALDPDARPEAILM